MTTLNKFFTVLMALLLSLNAVWLSMEATTFRQLSGTLLYQIREPYERSMGLDGSKIGLFEMNFSVNNKRLQGNKIASVSEDWTALQYNVNHPEELVYTDHEAIMSENKQLYPPSGVTPPGRIEYPRIVPGKNAVSFTADGRLYYFETGNSAAEELKITGENYISFTDHDWLDANTLIYTALDENRTDEANRVSRQTIMQYKLDTGESSILVDQAMSCAVSINQKYMSYMAATGELVVRDLSTDSETRAKLPKNCLALSTYPSPDGKYIACNLQYYSESGYGGTLGASNTTLFEMKTRAIQIVADTIEYYEFCWKESDPDAK